VHGGLAIPSADCVLVLGSAFNANVMYGGAPLFGTDQTIIQVDIAAERVGGNRAADVTVIGDIAAVMRDCCEAWTATPPGREEWLDRGRALAGASLEFWNRQIDEHTGERIHAGAAARTLADLIHQRFGGSATCVADGGDALAWALAYFRSELPGRLLTTTTALGTLGVGMPFALAAQAARPGEPVFLFTGDGSFGLSAMEVATAVRHHLPVIAIVSNNAGWGDVRYEQDELFPAFATIAWRRPLAVTASASSASRSWHLLSTGRSTAASAASSTCRPTPTSSPNSCAWLRNWA
jgi:acetolactate synthase-1/2/3 large subunit